MYVVLGDVMDNDVPQGTIFAISSNGIRARKYYEKYKGQMNVTKLIRFNKEESNKDTFNSNYVVLEKHVRTKMKEL